MVWDSVSECWWCRVLEAYWTRVEHANIPLLLLCNYVVCGSKSPLRFHLLEFQYKKLSSLIGTWLERKFSSYYLVHSSVLTCYFSPKIQGDRRSCLGSEQVVLFRTVRSSLEKSVSDWYTVIQAYYEKLVNPLVFNCAQKLETGN